MTEQEVRSTQERRAARRRDGRRAVAAGMALVGTMMALMLLLAFVLVGVVSNAGGNGNGSGSTGSVAGRSQQAVFSANQRVGRSLSLNAAETGVWMCMQWLNEQSTPPNDNGPFRPATNGRLFLPDLPATWKTSPAASPYGSWDQVNLPDQSLARVKIYPYANNSTLPQRSYVIEAAGEYKGRLTILRGVARQDTFAKYAFFSNEMPANYYVGGLTAFNGPVHLNGNAPLLNPTQKLNIAWSTDTAKNADGTYSKAIFRFEDAGSLTCAFDDDKINWFRGSVSGASNPPATDDEWKRVAVAGRTSIQLGMNKVAMPTVSTRQRDACLNGATAPTAAGVHLPGGSEGGIYIQGNVEDMRLEARNAPGGGTNNLREQRIEVYQRVPNPTSPGNTTRVRTVVVIDPVSNTTRLETSYPANPDGTNWQQATVQTFSGATNGVVYVNGHVGRQDSNQDSENNRGGVSGTVATGAKLNIVTEASKNLNIDGNIRLSEGSYTGPNGVTYARPGAGILGLVSNKVQIVTRDNYTSTATPTDLSIHATIMAYDTFRAIRPNDRAIGSLTRLGGTIVGRAGQFGEFNTDDLSLMNGFRVTNNYDDRMINDPPPHFPSTGNVYVLVSLERVERPLVQ